MDETQSDSAARQVAGSASAAKPEPSSHPPLNKWQTFWRGVLHIDAAKIDPWIALRNMIGVAAPLIVGLAIGMPLDEK